MGWLRSIGRDRPRTTTSPSHTAEAIEKVHPPAPIGERLGTGGLRDPDDTDRLARDGYVRLGQILSQVEVAAAAEVFTEARDRLGGALGNQWFNTLEHQDDEVRAFISDELGAIVGPKVESLFLPGEVDLLCLQYSVKPPSPSSALGAHQDFALVDERKAQSLYAWIPLCDTDELNGTLHVVPGSHHFASRIRGRHVPSYFDEVKDLVHTATQRLDCRAGELVVMVSGVIHSSPPNHSGELRLAAHGILKPAGAQILFYYADDDTPPGRVEVYELDIEGFVRATRLGRPGLTGSMARLEDRPPMQMSRERFLHGLAVHRSSGSTSG